MFKFFFESHSSVAGPALVSFSPASRGIAGGAKFCPLAGGISGPNQILSVLRVFFGHYGPDLGRVDPRVRFI